MQKNKRKEVSLSPYNFIELDNFVLDRCTDENEIINHDKFHENLNTGYIKYEIEVITPLHISGTKNVHNENLLFKNPEGKYAIPGNTIRGMTRYNASIFSLSSVINKSIKKYDIANQRFYYRTFASTDKGMKEWYGNKVGQAVEMGENFSYTILRNVEAGYIRKHGDGYIITPAVKLGNKSYTAVHEYDLRRKGIKGINYMYQTGLKKEDYKNKDLLKKKKNTQYKPYMVEINYSISGTKAFIDPNGKFKGYLLNSNYIDGKVRHYLVFEEDKSQGVIEVSREQAELYIEDMKYTQKQNANSDRANKRYEYYELPAGNNEVKPVFYIKEGDKLIFGFTPYLRLPAERDIYDGIPGTHRNYTGRDFVDAIFGWQDFRTKVSFLDALCEKNNVSEIKYKMVLGQPKPSWYKGYIKQRNADALESYCSENFEIRGRKFYWLKQSADTEAMQSSLPAPGKKDKISTAVYCYPEGTKFAGEVRFENLSDEELGLLIYSLKQGDTEGYFNIGRGKPYGLGKCRIRINRLAVYDISERYKSFAGNYEKYGDIDKYIRTFKDYVIKHYHTKINDVNEIKSYQEYLLSKKVMKNESTRYMNVREFSKRAELPTLEDVINDRKLSVKTEKQDNKKENMELRNNCNNYGFKNKNYRQKSKRLDNNRSRNTNLITNAFEILKEYKFDNNK